MIAFRFWLLSLFAAALAFWTSGCAHKPSSQTRVFQVKGVVQKLEADGKTVVVEHEEIPGYMQAMVMPLEVKETKELIGLSPGDRITFRMTVTDEEGWIDQIQKLASTNAPASKPRETYRKAPIVEPLNVGDPVPDYRFTNQLGQAISLHQFKGKALAIVFIYTRCPYPNFCPRMSGNFLDVQKKLKARPDGPKNWHLLSLSFDPAYDTPARLKDYAESVRHDPAWWSFATSDLWTIDGLTEQFGLQFWREEGSVIGHNVRTVVIDAQGRVQRIIPGTDWKADDLVDEIAKAAAK